MDFVERYLGVSPDGGDGLLEVLIIVLLVLIAAAICLCFTSRIRKREDRCGAVAGAAAILYVRYWPLADMAVALLKMSVSVGRATLLTSVTWLFSA